MKSLYESLLVAVLLSWNSPASALPFTMQPATVLQSYGNPEYYFDFQSNQFYGTEIWFGTANNANGYSPSLFYDSNAGNPANTYYSLWKDGLLRPSGTSAQSFIPRITNYGLWVEGGPNLDNNYLLCSRDLTTATCATAWNPTSLTATKTSVVGADGTTGNATKLTATAANGQIVSTISFNGALDFNNTSTVVAGGTNYVANNIITLSDGCATHATLKVLTVSGGAVLTVAQNSGGNCGSTLPTPPVGQLGAVTGGTQQTGAGATFTPFYRTGTFSCWMKRVTGTGAVNLSGNNFSTSINVSSLLSTAYYTQVRIPTFQLANNTVGIQLATSGDAVNVDFCQVEDDDQATSPIVTAGATNRRGTENAFVGTNNTNYNAGFDMINRTQAGTPVTFMVEYSANFSTTLRHAMLATDTPLALNGAVGGAGLVNGSLGAAITSNASDVAGVYTPNNIFSNGAGAVNKVVFAVDGSGASICVNGSAPMRAGTPVFPTSLAGGTHMNFLNNGGNIVPAPGYLMKFATWERRVSDGECTLYSTVFNNQ